MVRAMIAVHVNVQYDAYSHAMTFPALSGKLVWGESHVQRSFA